MTKILIAHTWHDYPGQSQRRPLRARGCGKPGREIERELYGAGSENGKTGEETVPLKNSMSMQNAYHFR